MILPLYLIEYTAVGFGHRQVLLRMLGECPPEVTIKTGKLGAESVNTTAWKVEYSHLGLSEDCYILEYRVVTFALC